MNFDILSPREKEVTRLLLQGKSNKQIAFSLGISERTVEFHLKNIYGKLQVASRVELIIKLGKSTGTISANPVESTVETDDDNVHNGNQPTARRRWAQTLRRTASLIKQEVAMTIRISLEELREFLHDHPTLFGLLIFIAFSLMTRYVVFNLGLYVWVSYILLGLALGAGSIYFGRLTMKLKNDKAPFKPLRMIVGAMTFPLIAAVFDQLYLNTVLRYTEPVSTTIANVSARAAWLTSPDGDFYRSTSLSSTSDILWFVIMGYTLVLFFLTLKTSQTPKQGNLSPT